MSYISFFFLVACLLFFFKKKTETERERRINTAAKALINMMNTEGGAKCIKKILSNTGRFNNKIIHTLESR